MKATIERPPITTICNDLRELQRQRTMCLKSRIMFSNRLTAQIAAMSGYHAGMEEGERTKRFVEASKVIERVRKGDVECETENAAAPLILAASGGIDGFDAMVNGFEKRMEKLAKQLPIAAWVNDPNQRGFGVLSLAIIVGECGDLNNYANPGKLWRRMGCAPYESRGVMHMGKTWRSAKPSLSAAEWEDYGYSPRRRSVMYVISESLMKGNTGGPYRHRYDTVKERCRETHPEWFVCKCLGTGKSAKGGKCGFCKGAGELKMHAHLHAMLLMTKLLLKNLWIEWTDGGNDCVDEPSQPWGE